MRKTLSLLKLLVALAAGGTAQAQGLTAAPDALGGPFWQARFERDAFSLLPPGQVYGQVQTLRLFGDYQLSTLRLGETGGLRLTGGLLINLRATPQGLLLGDPGSALPYAGIGYTSGGSAWGFSADLGLGTLRLDRAAGGIGDGSLQVQPMLRLGMNLAF